MKHSIGKFAAAVLAISAFAAQAQQSDLQAKVNAATAASSSQFLRGVVVTGSSDPLLRSDQRIALLSASLPLDAGSRAAQPATYERVVALFPQSPNRATGEARRRMESGQTPPLGSDPDGDISLGAR